MIDMSDDDLLPRMSLLLSPKPGDYEDDCRSHMTKPVSNCNRKSFSERFSEKNSAFNRFLSTVPCRDQKDLEVKLIFDKFWKISADVLIR
jgi:hypothetical protein